MLGSFRFHRPTALADAAKVLNADVRPIGGGTDLLPNLRRGLGEPSALVDLTAIPEMGTIAETAEGLRIGAGVTLERLIADPRLRDAFPAVVEAAQTVAGPTHRAAATLGGNLCQDTRCVYYNQSDWWRTGNSFCLKYQGDVCHVVAKSDRCYATYHGDVAPALMALNAIAEAHGPKGARRFPLAELFREDGKARLTIAENEFLAAVIVPSAKGWRCGYDKARVRDSVDFPLAGVAVALKREGDKIAGLRVAITGTNSAPLMIDTAKLAGGSWDAAAAETLTATLRKAANTLKTTVMGPKYRRRVLTVMARRLIDRLWAEAGR